MTERVLGPTGGRRRKRLALLVPFIAIAALILAIGASATVSDLSLGFEASDGNLVKNSATASPIDWNSFSRVDWCGTAASGPCSGSGAGPAAPYRVAKKTASSWDFVGIEDAQNSATDTSFAGGTKQDDNCASLGGPSPPNKDDLKRIYIASTTAPSTVSGTSVQAGDVILALAWERIPQNTTSASAHVAFEFNQGTSACGTLVHRSTANGGDVLIVYDFEGGSTDVPTLKVLRWASSGTCEQTGKAASAAKPCWIFGENATASGNAVAKVFVAPSAGATVLDQLAPPSSGTTSVDQDVGDREFGEAAIDLSAAGVFPRGTTTSCFTLGKAYAVSRSSGDSGNAAMKDIVGPAPLSITNCGRVIIHKTTVPTGGTGFPFTSNVSTDPADSSNLSFSLDHGGTKTINNALPGSYTVTETVASIGNYLLTDIDCSAGNLTPTSTNTTTGVTAFTMSAGKTLECTYTNTRQKVQSLMDTAPWYYPNDKATVKAGTGQTDVTGSVSFRLFGATTVPLKTALENCTADDGTATANGKLYSQSVDLATAVGTSKDVNTSNTGTKVESTATVYWRVSYSGDLNHFGRNSTCVENINATLTGDTNGTNVP